MCSNDIIVTIYSLCYNQECYVRQCLDGIVMQKTNFKFEAIIHDDASTDATADIIREYEAKYPNIIKPIYQTENQYSKRDFSISKILKLHTHGKYIAMCEGDDFWVDPYKLQKQVDFLESHPEFSLCCNRIQKLYSHDDKYVDDPFGDRFSNNDYFYFNREENMRYWYTQTNAVMYRLDCLNIDKSHFKYYNDTHMNYFLLSNGNGCMLSFIGGVYRIHDGGVFSSVTTHARASLSYKIYKEIYQYSHDVAAYIHMRGYYSSLIYYLITQRKMVVVDDMFDFWMLIKSSFFLVCNFFAKKIRKFI